MTDEDKKLDKISDEELVDLAIDECIRTEHPEIEQSLLSRLERGRKAVEACEAFETLINNSQGVYGLHLNGATSPWCEILGGGYYERWLIAFSEYQQSCKEDEG